MSIKVENGIPIVPQPLPSVTNEVVFTVHDSLAISEDAKGAEIASAITEASVAFSETTDRDSIEFPLSEQERTLWCWAACAKMVLFSLGQHHLRQCGIAQALITEDCCAASCGKKCCNNDCSEDDVLTVYQAFGINADFHEGLVSFARLQKEISEKQLPIEVAIDWPGDNGGHLLVVNGWSRHQNRRRVKIKDPYYGEGEVRYSELTRYKGGQWVFTWTGFREED